MEPAVSTVLAEVLSQLTAWGDLEDLWVLQGFQANRKLASQAGGVPHSRRNSWQTQAPGFTNFSEQNTVVTGSSSLILLSTFSLLRFQRLNDWGLKGLRFGNWRKAVNQLTIPPN